MNPDAIAQIYASDVVSGFDIYKPEKMNVLFNRYGDQGLPYYQLIRSMGFEQQVSNDTYGHYEDNRIHEVVRVRDIVAQPAIGADIQFTLDADSLDANNYYYVRLRDIIMFPNEVPGQVITIDVSTPSAPVVTCRLIDDTDRFPALTADEELIIITNAFAEGSGQPAEALSGTWEYSNNCQIIKETIGFTGTEMTNQTWFDVTSMGQKIPAFYFKGQTEIDYRMALRIDGALLFGKKNSNALLIDTDNNNRLIKTTEGLVPYIRRVGNEQTYTVGSFAVSELNDISKTLDRQGAGNYIMGLLGIDLHAEIEDKLVTYFANSNIQYARQTANDVLFNKSESLGASVNFTYMTKSERTFLFKRMGSFNNPKMYGATGYNMSKYGLFLPINQRKDPVSGNMVDAIGCRYKGLGAYNRRMEVWNVGGAGPGLKVTQYDKSNTYQRANIGAHYRGGNQFLILEPDA